jgi:hypothetical protein
LALRNEGRGEGGRKGIFAVTNGYNWPLMSEKCGEEEREKKGDGLNGCGGRDHRRLVEKCEYPK